MYILYINGYDNRRINQGKGGHGACAIDHPCQAETGSRPSYGRSQHVMGLAYWFLFIFIAKVWEFVASLDIVLHIHGKNHVVGKITY